MTSHELRSLTLVGHRGAPIEAPENTMASFARAASIGVSMIELDVHATRDGILVVIHDATLKRTTNGKGKISEFKWSELRSFDAGSWFSPQYKNERIPSLEEVYDQLDPRVRINIEIKSQGITSGRHSTERLVASFLRDRGFDRPTLVSSFHHRGLKRFHELCPEVPVGVLYQPVRDVRKKPSTLAQRTGASVFICHLQHAGIRVINDCHKNGIRIAVYGADTERAIRSAVSRGVDAIVTNDPRLANLILSEYDGTTAVSKEDL